MSLQTKYHWCLVLVLLLTVMLRVPSLEYPFDNDSGANAYHARQITRGHPLYGTHHSQHQLPGIYYTYALAFELFGDSLWAIKSFLILWTVLTVALIYRLGQATLGPLAGTYAALFYALLSSHLYLFGITAENELFANLPRTVAVLLLVNSVDRETPIWRWFLIGIWGAISFLFRAVYLSPMLLAGIAMVFLWWRDKRGYHAGRLFCKRALGIAGGFILVLLLVTAYFYSQGLLSRMLLVFKLGTQYVKAVEGIPSFLLRLAAPLIAFAYNNFVLLLFSLLEIAALSKLALEDKSNWSSMTFLKNMIVVLWFFLAYLETCVSEYRHLHYYLLIVPPLAILAGGYLARFYDKVSEQYATEIWKALLVAGCYLTLIVGISVAQNFGFYAHYFRYQRGLERYEDFVLNSWDWDGEGLNQVQALADYVAGETGSDDLVYYWSNSTQFYYLADRRCAIDIIWPRYAEATGSYKRIFVPQTKYIILGESPAVARPDWLYDGLAAHYKLEKVIGREGIYRRAD